MAKAAFNKKRALLASTLDLELRKKLVKCYIWSIALYGAETWTLLRRNCLLQRVRKDTRGIEVTGRRGRKRKKLLDDLKERRGYSHLKEEALDRTMCRARFGRGLGPVVRQNTK
jgi:hypothetical protein